jgi:organic hydroperoxide reductase OsmC/OhrA
MNHTHSYQSRLSWEGSTAAGYDSYDRTHTVTVPPARAALRLSSDPAFNGDAGLANPEQLFLAAASSCQMLMFLAIAARSQVDVIAYEDEADATMPEDTKPMRITQITLRPRVTIRSETDLDRVRRIVSRAHERCFIANSINAEINIDAVIEYATSATGRATEPRP